MSENLKTPYQLVAFALNISPDLLNDDSALGEVPNWDSLNHVGIISELESNYGIEIPDEEIESYITMKSIIDLHRSKTINE